MKIRNAYVSLGVCILHSACIGSVEYPIPLDYVHIKGSETIEGNVEVTMTLKENQITQLDFIDNGEIKKVPEKAYESLKNISPGSLHLRQATGYPVLYICFKFWEYSNENGERIERIVNIAIEDGRITRRSISTIVNNCLTEHTTIELISSKERKNLFVHDESWNDDKLKGPQAISPELKGRMINAIVEYTQELGNPISEVEKIELQLFDKRSDLSPYFAYGKAQIREPGFIILGLISNKESDEGVPECPTAVYIELDEQYDIVDIVGER